MRYPALRVIVVLHYCLAAVVLLVATVAANAVTELAPRTAIILGAAASILLIVGFAEVLRVVMDIEENTRPPAAPTATPEPWGPPRT